MKPKTILLATDLSPRCDRALDRAAALAAEWQAKLVALHALQDPVPASDLPSWRRPADPLQAAMQRVRNDLEGTAGVAAEIQVERGEPAAVILAAIERTGSELLVTGVARDETLGRVLLGTTVEKVVRKASVPCLVAKSRPRGPYRNIVVATDFSEGSRHALETALAVWPAARLSAFHAFSVPYQGLAEDTAAAREAAARQANAQLQEFLAATPAAAGRRIETLCEYGDPGVLLEDLTLARKVDLVVAGTEGRSGLAHALLGSVAHRLAGRLPVDVLLVRRPRG